MKIVSALSGLSVLFLLAQSQNVLANPQLIATIDGAYDSVSYDTPDLVFENSSSYDFTNVQMVLTGYQGLNNGLTATVDLSNIAAGTNLTYVWNGTAPTSGSSLLTAYDYDDEHGQTTTNPLCVVGQSLCSFVGNFSVTFTATLSGAGPLNGQNVFSQFSPGNNATGGFLGWEGLDPTGLSETVYDQHSGSTSTVNGTLAKIYLGDPGTGFNPNGTAPEPTSIALLAAGLLGFGATRRKSV